MLSKSQARAFFLAGTALCVGVFVFLTVDSLGQLGARTKTQNLTAEVIRGKEIWESKNCMGCHTLLGEGAYYAPDLTRVYERRGPVWMKAFIKDPQAMFPGERKMVKYDFTDGQIDDVIAFLKWCGEIDTNGWPVKPDIQPIGVGAATPAQQIAAAKVDLSKAPAQYTQICTACHALGGQGGNVGPALDGVGARRDAAYLEQWLADPQGIKPGTAMPKLPLTDAERRELVTFLSGLK